MHVVHPFPARMAPEIAKEAVRCLGRKSVLLDPMCGSGTVVRSAVEHGVQAFASDVDPLAVLMTRVWTSQQDTYRLAHDAVELIERAKALRVADVRLDWHDEETTEYVKYWFAQPQRAELARIATVLRSTRLRTRRALMLALSRIIITKDRGASLARDVSHSRPHRVSQSNSYEVYAGFLRSAQTLASKLNPQAIAGNVEVRQGDGRALDWLQSCSVDCIITSPPYLNAIDYLRGHRLALVWLGYTVAETRKIRSDSVGSERAPNGRSFPVEAYIRPENGSALPARQAAWVSRYAEDAQVLINEMTRVIKPGGQIVLVVGNSFLRGCRVDNAKIFGDLLGSAGGRVTYTEREIPARRRYLPPPSGSSTLATRMRTEVVIRATM